MFDLLLGLARSAMVLEAGVNKRYTSLILAVALSAGFFWLALRKVSFHDVLGAFARARLAWLPLLILLPLVDVWIRALRWRILMLPVARTSSGKLFKLEAIGLAMNNLLFMRIGELARAGLTATELDVPMPSVLGTVLVERLCDTAALFLLFGVGALCVPGVVHPTLRTAALIAATAIVAVLAALSFWGVSLLRWIRTLRRAPRLELFLEELMTGTQGFRDFSAVLQVAALSLGLWLSDTGVYWCAAYAASLKPDLSFLRSVVVLASAAASSALPMVPGSWGGFEAAVQAILVHFGYGASEALGYAALVHIVVYIVITALGIVFLYSLGHTFSSLQRMITEK